MGKAPLCTKKAKSATHRVFVRKLPFVVNASALRAAIRDKLLQTDNGERFKPHEQVSLVHWLADKSTGLFYGSALLQMGNADAARALCESNELLVGGKKAQVKLSPLRADEEWPPANYVETDLPKIS